MGGFGSREMGENQKKNEDFGEKVKSGEKGSEFL